MEKSPNYTLYLEKIEGVEQNTETKYFFLGMISQLVELHLITQEEYFELKKMLNMTYDESNKVNY